ncbi:MAG: cytochrome c biogenesis protein CcdA [Pyrinomonadaceae bacterium]
MVAQDPTKWSLESDSKGKVVETEATFKVVLKADIEPGWHLYAPDQPSGGPIATTFKPAESDRFTISPKIEWPEPRVEPDPNFIIGGKPLETKFFVDNAEFRMSVTAGAKARVDEVAVDVRFQLCNDTYCLPPRTKRVSIAGETTIKRSVDGQQSAAADQQPGKVPVQNAVQPEQAQNDLWAFLWLAVTLGALSLLTPCVFPMIPITVSYFTNHSAGHRSRAVKLASVYSLGIISTFTLLGMLLAIFVGASGINLFAANPWINLLITAIFLFFAFNLFGAYEINIPTGLLTKLDGMTRGREGEGSGVAGALLMGLTFTLTSFTCTSPFVGTLLVSASQGDWQRPMLGMLAFSTVFALPFFVLALIPQWLSQLPRAGGWMNSVKVAMGFLEVAAAMKFLSNVDLVWKWGIFTRDVVLSIWIAIGIILAIYLLGKFQLTHDSKPERIGAFRLASAIVSLAISFYLLTGLFGAKLGELESFLPPDLEGSSSRFYGAGKDELDWITNDYDAALAKGRAENKKVFVDFTGYTCTNCRWMEANVFTKKEVESELRQFVLVKLFTDGEGEIYERHQTLEEEMFGTVAMPYYAVINTSGTADATFPGLTRNVSEFVDFLKNARVN